MLSTIQNWLRNLAPQRPRASPRRVPRNVVHYWINPSGARERARWMCSEFDAAGVRHERVAACTPTDLPPLLLPTRNEASALQIACVCSHLAAIEQGLASGAEMFVVMEDDMMLPFDVDFERLSENAPTDWQILQLYVVNAERLHAMYTRSYRRGRLWERWKVKNHSTGAYLCSWEAAQNILAAFKPHGIIDFTAYKGILVADELLYKTVPTYSLTYPLYIENDAFESTLDSLRRLHLASHAAVRRIWSESATPEFAMRREAGREQPV